MSPHNILDHIFTSDHAIADPGDTKTILVDRALAIVHLISGANAEVRTLADPTSARQELTLFMITDGGGVITITADSPVNQSGNTTLVFGDVFDQVDLVSVQDVVKDGSTAAAYRWSVVGGSGGSVALASYGDDDPILFGDDSDAGIEWNTTLVALSFKSGSTAVAALYAGGLQDHGVEAVTATAGGATTGLITQGSKNVTATSDGATKAISLPAAVIGDVIQILVLGAACELISAVAAHKVNNVVVGATNELALAENATYVCRYVATNEWKVTGINQVGVVITPLAPNIL